MGVIRKKIFISSFNEMTPTETIVCSYILSNIFLPKLGKGDFCFESTQIIGDKKRLKGCCPYYDADAKFCWYHLKKCHATRLRECWAELRELRSNK